MVTFELLSLEEKKQIHLTAVKILTDVGMKFHHKEALDILKEAGADVDYENELVKIPVNLIDNALKTVPEKFSMYNREMTEEYVWGDSEINLGAGGSVISILDSDGKTFREPKTEDLINM